MKLWIILVALLILLAILLLRGYKATPEDWQRAEGITGAAGSTDTR